MGLQELYTELDLLLAPYDPAGPWPFLIELEAMTIVAKIERLQLDALKRHG